MHMSNALVSAPVGCAMWAVSGGLFTYSIYSLRHAREDFSKNNSKSNLLLMGVLGAFVFAAQMLNFALPNAGVSGHIVGAVFLAALLGPHRAFVTMSIILLTQALCLGDGGLLALGCNIFNMAAIGCFVAYPLIYKPVAKHGNIVAASVASCAVAIPLGALCIALQTLFSSTVPFAAFASLLVPVHFAIGLAEGAVMSAILLLVQQLKDGSRMVWTGAASLVIIGVLALFTSSAPDGLQWALDKTLGDTNSSHAISDIK